MKDNIRYKMCIKKRSYPSKKKALQVANRMKRIGRKGIKPYPCVFCGAWHNGHSKINPVGPDGLIVDKI